MNELISVKTEIDDLIIESQITANDRIEEQLLMIDEQLSEQQSYLRDIDKELERLTYDGDKYDILVSVASGIISGFVDIFFVGELGLFEGASDSAKEKYKKDKAEVHEKLNKFIESYAKKKGYKGDGLKGAIEFLEKKYKVPQDNVWKGKKISSADTHHLDDLAHHPSLLGLVSSIMVQFMRISVFSSKDGSIHLVFVKPSKKEVVEIIAPVVISGLIKWLLYLAEKKEVINVDGDIPKPVRFIIDNLHKTPYVIMILKTVDNWFGHLVSDMGGSKNTPDGGTGIPGLFLSLLKEISMLPILKDSGLSEFLNDLYQNTKNSPLTDKLDLRAELPVIKEQILPVLINELLVRSFYFVYHLIKELKNKDKKSIEWNKVIPFYNRTIIRMMTVSTGVFTAVDLADAAIETAVKNPEACASVPTFFTAMAMRVNFVGVGRFAIALTSDLGMGTHKLLKENERLITVQYINNLTDSKMYYKLADLSYDYKNLLNKQSEMHTKEMQLWTQLKDTHLSVCDLYDQMGKTGIYYLEAINKMNSGLDDIEESIDEIEELNPGIREELLNRLDRGRNRYE